MKLAALAIISFLYAQQVSAIWYYMSRYGMKRSLDEGFNFNHTLHGPNRLDKRAYSIGIYKLCKDVNGGRQCVVDTGGINTIISFAVENSGYPAGQDLFEAIGSYNPEGTIFTGNWRSVSSNTYLEVDGGIGTEIFVRGANVDAQSQIWLVQGVSSWKGNADSFCPGYQKPTFGDGANNNIVLACEDVDNQPYIT